MRTTLLHLLLIAAAVGAVFGQSLHADLLSWDDEGLITLNNHVTDGNLQGLIWHWTHAHLQLYIPVVYSVWWLICATAGLKPVYFHAANLLVHTADACFVYAILRMLVGRAWPALGGALLFAVHPLQVEPVCWATGMKDLLCTFFSLLTLLFYLRPRFYWAATICFVAAMLCKPSAAILPLIAVAIDFLVVHRRPSQTYWRLSPWLASAILVAYVTSLIQPALYVASGPLWARPLIACDSLTWYLQKLFLPINLAIDQGRRPPLVISWHILGIPWLALAWIIPLLAALVVIRLRRPMLTLSAWIFLLALLPVLGLKSFDFQRFSTVADRYAHFAMLGPALAAAWLLARWKNRAAFWVTAAVLLTLGSDSFLQAQYWSDDVALYSHSIEVTPDSYFTHYNLGVAYDRLSRESKLLGRPGDAEEFEQKAKAEFQLAEVAVRNFPDAYLQLAQSELQTGQRLGREGERDRARGFFNDAITHFNGALKLDPYNTDARQGLANTQRELDQLK